MCLFLVITKHNNKHQNLAINAYRILVGKQEEIDHWEDQGIGWWTILK
jgi:hypothetical protein